MTDCAIMLGGNLDGTAGAMSSALQTLRDSGFIISAVSSPHHSAAVDCVPGTPDFIDVAVTGSWHGSAEELLALCQKLERAAGRPAVHSSRESRILDCDIIIFGNELRNSPHLTIPHPRAKMRLFVLEPLAEIAPQMLFPDDGTSVAENLHKLRK